MIKVAITTYPTGKSEETVWTTMPQAPRVGESVAFDHDDVPILRITHVRWVQGRNEWWAECSAS